MANAPTFEFPILFPRETCTTLLAHEQRRANRYDSRFVKNYAPMWKYNYSKYNSAEFEDSSNYLVAEDEMRKRREKKRSGRLDCARLFSRPFFSRGKGSNGFCDVFPLYPFLRVMILNICTSNDKLKLCMLLHTYDGNIYTR